MIRVKNLTKSTVDGERLLSGIDLEIHRGDLVVILGSSGSGKSVLLRCLDLRERWDKGKLIYNNQDILEMGWSGRRLIRKEWAYMEGQPVMLRNKSALKNVLTGSRKRRPIWRLLTGLVSDDEYSDGMDYLIKAGLMDSAHRQVDKLSGGEVQRVALARALAEDPKVLVADEPVSNLDPHTTRSIMEIIQKMCKNDGLICICTLPQIELAEQFATRIVGLNRGEVVFDIRGRRLTLHEKSMMQ